MRWKILRWICHYRDTEVTPRKQLMIKRIVELKYEEKLNPNLDTSFFKQKKEVEK